MKSLVALLEPYRSCLAISFFHNYKVIDRQVLEAVDNAAWPAHFQQVDFIALTQSKKYPRILRRAITHSAFRLIVARQISSHHFERGPVPVAITFRPD